MKYEINIDSVVYWEGARISLETEPGETEDLAKATKEIYSAFMEAFKPIMMQSLCSTPTAHCSCQSTTADSSETSFKEVEKEESKPVKKAKKEKEKDDEDEYI